VKEEGGEREGRDEGMEDREKTCKHRRETAKPSAHVPGSESFSLPDLTFSTARNSTSGLAKETMQHSSAGPQSKCEMFWFSHLQNKRNTTVTV